MDLGLIGIYVDSNNDYRLDAQVTFRPDQPQVDEVFYCMSMCVLEFGS
jgi:hypothetical protein